MFQQQTQKHSIAKLVNKIAKLFANNKTHSLSFGSKRLRYKAKKKQTINWHETKYINIAKFIMQMIDRRHSSRRVAYAGWRNTMRASN